MSNSERKRVDAFYHNQLIDYNNWLRLNAVCNRREMPRKTKSPSLFPLIAAGTLSHNGFNSMAVRYGY